MGNKKASETVDYASTSTPSDYKCKGCGATGCKLWREWNTFAPTLLCVDCAIKDQKKNIVVDEDGMHASEYGGPTDTIGWYAPAVPTKDNHAYWGYTSVPDEGCKWWKNLPLRATP